MALVFSGPMCGAGYEHQSILGFDYTQMQFIAAGDQGPEGMGRFLVL